MTVGMKPPSFTVGMRPPTFAVSPPPGTTRMPSTTRAPRTAGATASPQDSLVGTPVAGGARTTPLASPSPPTSPAPSSRVGRAMPLTRSIEELIDINKSITDFLQKKLDQI